MLALSCPQPDNEEPGGEAGIARAKSATTSQQNKALRKNNALSPAHPSRNNLFDPNQKTLSL
jgi:hypothetical protein